MKYLMFPFFVFSKVFKMFGMFLLLVCMIIAGALICFWEEYSETK